MRLSLLMFAKKSSLSILEPILKRKSQRHFLTGFRTKQIQPCTPVTKISAPISFRAISTAIFTIKLLTRRSQVECEGVRALRVSANLYIRDALKLWGVNVKGRLLCAFA